MSQVDNIKFLLKKQIEDRASQAQIARLLGVDRTTINRQLNGSFEKTSISKLVEILEALGVDTIIDFKERLGEKVYKNTFKLSPGDRVMIKDMEIEHYYKSMSSKSNDYTIKNGLYGVVVENLNYVPDHLLVKLDIGGREVVTLIEDKYLASNMAE